LRPVTDAVVITSPKVRRWLVRNFELITVVVMSAAAILTAWSGFQGAQWTAIQTEAYAQATDNQTESVRASNEARQATTIDVAVFIAWIERRIDDDLEAAEFIYEGFPDRLSIATDAWLAEDPFDDPEAPTTPFVMPEYVVPAAEEADALALSAEEHTLVAQEAAENANAYVLMTVLLAIVLFFASVSTKLTGLVNRWAMLIMSIVGLLAGAVILLTFPRA
jgi:type II secretory pathway pseudopilin PulG